MYTDEIINKIVAEVLKRLQEKMKKATVLFTGGAYGYQEAIQQVKLLLEDGWNFNVLLSNSASYILTPQLIKEELQVSTVYVESEVKGLKSFYEGIGALIIPTLTINSAVKISLGIADNMTTNLVSHVMMSGIPVIAAKDGCDLNNPIRKQLGLNKAPMAYQENIDRVLEKLVSYGVQLVKAKGLFDEVQKNVMPITSQVKRKREIQIFKKNVLTRMDIIDAKQQGVVIKVPRTTIVSPLALESAREYGVEMIRD